MTDATKKLFADAINAGEIILWEDPGHGWLQVPLPLINALKNECNLEISGYSYKDSRNAYLEEDCDLSAFCACFPWVNFRDYWGVRIERKYQEQIFIRRLNHVA